MFLHTQRQHRDSAHRHGHAQAGMGSEKGCTGLEHLPSKHEALSSSPSIATHKKEVHRDTHRRPWMIPCPQRDTLLDPTVDACDRGSYECYKYHVFPCVHIPLIKFNLHS
jgi:hypothetical protein